MPMVPAPQTTAQCYNPARYDPRPEGPRWRAKSAPNNRSRGLRSRDLSFRDKRRRFPLPQRGKKALENLLSGLFWKIMFSTPNPTLTTAGEPCPSPELCPSSPGTLSEPARTCPSRTKLWAGSGFRRSGSGRFGHTRRD